jgi:C4-dicarboxylate-specific signal transduction histidine kinase
MDRRKDLVFDEGLAFFGKMSAGISHEIKNCLAIVNENAGLLEDFSMMAEKGTPLDPERLNRLAEKIKKQVRRANEIVKHMNQLAHSSDRPAQETDLGETLVLMCAVAKRFATMQGVSLQPVIPEHPIMVVTTPFRLKHLIWRCIEYVIHQTEEERTIELMLDKKADGVRITFRPIDKLDDSVDEMLIHSGTVKDLLDELGASLSADKDKEELNLGFPIDKSH